MLVDLVLDKGITQSTLIRQAMTHIHQTLNKQKHICFCCEAEVITTQNNPKTFENCNEIMCDDCTFGNCECCLKTRTLTNDRKMTQINKLTGLALIKYREPRVWDKIKELIATHGPKIEIQKDKTSNKEAVTITKTKWTSETQGIETHNTSKGTQLGCICCRNKVYKTRNGCRKNCNNTKLYTNNKTIKLDKATAIMELGMRKCTKKSRSSNLTRPDTGQGFNRNITRLLTHEEVSQVVISFMQTHPDIKIMAKRTTDIISIKHIGKYGYTTCMDKNSRNTEQFDCDCHMEHCPYCNY